jgi:hypothetical protein
VNALIYEVEDQNFSQDTVYKPAACKPIVGPNYVEAEVQADMQEDKAGYGP